MKRLSDESVQWIRILTAFLVICASWAVLIWGCYSFIKSKVELRRGTGTNQGVR